MVPVAVHKIFLCIYGKVQCNLLLPLGLTHKELVSESKKSITQCKESIKKENTVYNQYRQTKKIKIILYFIGVGILIAALTVLLVYLMVTPL